MPRFKNRNGVRIQFTAEEETARDNEETVKANAAPALALARMREKRNILLAETDFYALSDVSMTQDMTNYRQALRDLPEGLTTVEDVEAVTFPTKP